MTTIGKRLTKTGALFGGILGPGLNLKKCLKLLDR
jgi:hypothetical protein